MYPGIAFPEYLPSERERSNIFHAGQACGGLRIMRRSLTPGKLETVSPRRRLTLEETAEQPICAITQSKPMGPLSNRRGQMLLKPTGLYSRLYRGESASLDCNSDIQPLGGPRLPGIGCVFVRVGTAI